MALKRWLAFNPSRKRLEAFIARAAQSMPAGGLVLDAGAGETCYRSLFGAARYQAADFAKVAKAYGKLDYICDLASIPAKDNAYDLVLLTQVMEHLPEPGRVLAEIYRVLKPGGTLWFSAPLYFPEHEIPYDFFRYTRFGLERLMCASGFQLEEITWLEGYYGALSFQLRQAFHALPASWSAYGRNAFGLLAFLLSLLLKPLFFGLSLFYARLEMSSKFTGKGLCKNYCGVALKPS